NDIGMRVEHLFEEGCTRARMAAEKSDTARRLKPHSISPPTSQNVGGNGLSHLFGAVLHDLQSGGVGCCVGALNGLCFEKRRHGIVVSSRAVENAGEIV